MTKGSGSYDRSASKTVATTGYASSVPVKSTVSFKGSGAEEGSYQNTYRFSYGDKQTGSYGRATATEKASAGEFQWKNGTTGTKSEYTHSSTVRFGDKSGYTEVHNEQRVRNVVYDKSGCSSKSYVTYEKDDGGAYGGGGYGNQDSDDDDGGAYGGSGFNNEDDGSYGGSDYGYNDDYGSDGGYGYDSDY
ncbi:hypothetical protein SSX86_020224 [Deinandra increscens subsp. villosa]|uniref:Uncharacterized protein n=1 Tax=Deinandra increscens subsp. villosa TaxID=3103831 RepID=A0AAP0GUG3_9ASTR